MAAVLEPASCGGNLPIPAQPWIPVRYGTDAIPVIGAPDPAAATSTLARAVSGLPGLMKAVLDVLVALLLLVVLSPVLVALALAVRADGDPAFFRQTRVGLDGREFTMVKFRSMVVDAEARLAALQAENEGAGPLFKLRHDPRVTRVGEALRKYSLDELPQLFNVVTGRMSLIGPRPALPRERVPFVLHTASFADRQRLRDALRAASTLLDAGRTRSRPWRPTFAVTNPPVREVQAAVATL